MAFQHDQQTRLDAARGAMVRQGLDLVMFSPSPCLQYLAGIPRSWWVDTPVRQHRAMLFLPAHGDAVLVLEPDMHGFDNLGTEVSTLDEAARIVAKTYGSEIRTIGVGNDVDEADRAVVSGLIPTATWTATAGLLNEARRIKDDVEIRSLRRAAAIADAVMAAIVPQIREGVTQDELACAIGQEGLRRGADCVSFPPAAMFVASGSEVSDNPFLYPREKGLVPGTSVAFDFGFVVDGYCSDYGRSFHCGRAGTEVRDAYKALQRATCDLVAMIRPGSTTCGELYPAVEKLLDAAGFGNQLRARLTTGNLGHHIGIELHEDPWLTPESKVVLAPGMVMAIEPKLWHAGEYYLRVEDIVLIGEEKAEFLTTFDREMFEL